MLLHQRYIFVAVYAANSLQLLAAAAKQDAGEQAAERGWLNKRGCHGPACEYDISSAPFNPPSKQGVQSSVHLHITRTSKQCCMGDDVGVQCLLSGSEAPQ